MIVEAVAKLLYLIKPPFSRHFSLPLLAVPVSLQSFALRETCNHPPDGCSPIRVWSRRRSRTSKLVLRTDAKIIDFLRHWSFATASVKMGRSQECKGFNSKLILGQVKRRFVLAVLVLFFSFNSLEAKVYDCFMFFNEIELLKMRLEELDPVVDYFVLVENAETQRGQPKPFCFKENRALFEKYLPKIIHVVVDERHPEFDLWDREHFQRSCIARGLKNCKPSDIILISDLDEIPRPELVQSMVKLLPERSAKLLKEGKAMRFKKYNKKKTSRGKKEKAFYLDAARGFQMPYYWYQLNRRTDSPWVGTVATTYEMVEKFGVQHFRSYRWKFPQLSNSGWHFTWMGGRDKIRLKLRSLVEGDEAQSNASDAEIDAKIKSVPVVPIDSSFPKYVQRNLEYLKAKGFIGE